MAFFQFNHHLSSCPCFTIPIDRALFTLPTAASPETSL
jgi:hypothetical protein